MQEPLLYLDNCCFNRPYDDQSHIRISLETQAKLYIQQKIKVREYVLVWSFALTAENDENPFVDRKQEISKWENLAETIVRPDISILRHAKELQESFGMGGKDALHVACAFKAECDYLLTTDDKFLKKTRTLAGLIVMNPIHFVELMEEPDDADENRHTATL